MRVRWSCSAALAKRRQTLPRVGHGLPELRAARTAGAAVKKLMSHPVGDGFSRDFFSLGCSRGWFCASALTLRKLVRGQSSHAENAQAPTPAARQTAGEDMTARGSAETRATAVTRAMAPGDDSVTSTEKESEAARLSSGKGLF